MMSGGRLRFGPEEVPEQSQAMRHGESGRYSAPSLGTNRELSTWTADADEGDVVKRFF